MLYFDHTIVLFIIGCLVGTAGTLIGAGGGFVVVPILLLTHPDMRPEIVTAISICIVATNAISGSVAYARSGRIDYRAGLLFALFTIPGSILGVYTVDYIPKSAFRLVFGILLIALSGLLFFSKEKPALAENNAIAPRKGLVSHHLTDRFGVNYAIHYNPYIGIFISLIVGYLSPLLGIGGGIIHVPALINWLNFPVFVATATSHFILAIMSSVSVITHLIKGSYHDPLVQKMVLCMGAGAILGAQVGAQISHKVKSTFIIKALAVCLALVGARILSGG